MTLVQKYKAMSHRKTAEDEAMELFIIAFPKMSEFTQKAFIEYANKTILLRKLKPSQDTANQVF